MLSRFLSWLRIVVRAVVVAVVVVVASIVAVVSAIHRLCLPLGQKTTPLCIPAERLTGPREGGCPAAKERGGGQAFTEPAWAWGLHAFLSLLGVDAGRIEVG